MTGWIGLTERKNSQKRKDYVGWISIVFHENLIASEFLIQRNFRVGSVYSLFHEACHSYDVISNARPSRFEWFNKTKTLCKIITLKKHAHQIEMSLNRSEEDSNHLSKWREQEGEEYKDAEEEVEDIGKRKRK